MEAEGGSVEAEANVNGGRDRWLSSCGSVDGINHYKGCKYDCWIGGSCYWSGIGVVQELIKRSSM